jgi:hypothetical protein
MTLGKLKAELEKIGIYSVGSLSFQEVGGKPEYVTVYFSTDENPVFPFPLKDFYALITRTGLDEENIHREKIKALKRTLIPAWDED